MRIKCLILAAGNGSRLRQKGLSKPLVPLLGIPLIERAIRSAMEAGTDDFYVVTGYQGDLVRDFLERLAKRLAIRITPLVNDDWEKEKRAFSTQGTGSSASTVFCCSWRITSLIRILPAP